MRTRRTELGLLIGLCLATAALTACDDDNDAFTVPSPGQGVTPGDVTAVTSTGRLVTFNRAMPNTLSSAVNITGLGAGETVLGVDIRPGGATANQIYLLGSTGKLYTVDPTTGTATVKSTLMADATDTTNPFTALSGTEYGVDFNPVVDRLRVVSDTGQNLRINVDTGATITDGPLNNNSTTVTRMGITDAAYTNDFATTCRTTLYFIDPTTDKLLLTNDPNNGVITEVGALGVDASSVGAFEIATAADGTNTALAVFTVNNASTLYSINLTTGAATSVGAVGNLNMSEVIRGVSTSAPATGPANAFGQVAAVTASGKLISFQSGSPQKLCTNTALTGLQAGETVLGIDTRPANGTMYALGSTGRVYSVNTGTAALTQVSALAPATGDAFTALSGTEFGVDFNPVPDRLRIVSDTGQNLRVNVDTGAVTSDLAINPAGPIATGAAYTNAFAGAGTTTLYDIDTTNDQLVIQGAQPGPGGTPASPNNGDLTAVGPLGVGDVQSISGFDINGLNNSAIAALNIGTATTSDFYNINLATGVATRVNTIGGGEKVRGLTLTAVPKATLYGTTTDNKLVTFQIGTPGTFDASVAISGVQGGDQIIGADFRPANGKLYALASSGRLYTVDPATGNATLATTLMADAADTTDGNAAFTTIMGTQFGVDFNPVADRLRVVSNMGQSLRINVDTGATTTDLNLVPTTGVAMVVASGYTNSFTVGFGVTNTTQLFDIDLATSSLQLQNPPNAGTLTPVGTVLDPTNGTLFTGTGGFDIAGGDNGLSLAALQPTGAAQSTLYRLNVKTGVVTSVGTLGPAGSPALTGIAISLK